MPSDVLHPNVLLADCPQAILPDHRDYDQARTAWNLAADQRPRAVVVAHAVDDVVTAVRAARKHGLRVAPQGTGHLASALPALDDAVLVRTAIGGVEVDVENRRARVGAGATWKDVVDAVTPHGLAALSGSSHDVGVLGYTLGGGASWLARQHGLAANNVHALELVTADGHVVRTDHEHEPDLFWALRGGGGNFGIVTHVELNLFAVTTVFAGMTVWPASAAREVITEWEAWCRTAPDAATTSLRLLRLPPDPALPEALRDTPLVVVDGAVLGHDPERVLAGLRGIGAPIMDTWQPMSPAGLLEIHMDPPMPVPARGDTALLGDLDAAAIDALLDVVDAEEVSPLLFAELRQLGGAMGRAPDGAGARATFDGRFLLFAVGMPTSAEHAAALDRRLDELLAAMRPWCTGLGYLNFAERGGDARLAFDETTYARLQSVRRVWDPDEVFIASHPVRGDA